MFLTQWRVQLLSSVAPSTPLVIIHSCERALECTLKAHWLSSIAPCKVTGSSLSLSLSLLLSLPALPALNKVEAETSTKTSNNVVLVFFSITGDPLSIFPARISNDNSVTAVQHGASCACLHGHRCR